MTKKFLLPSLLLLAGFLITGWISSTSGDSYTDYYYYENERYYLVPAPDKIFVELDDTKSTSDVNRILGMRNSLFNLSDFDENESRQILSLVMPMDNSSLRSLVNEMNNMQGIVNASPVFKMPEGKGNANTFIGVEKEIIAQFKPTVSDNEISSYILQRGMQIVSGFDLTGGKSYLIRVPEGAYSVDYANELHLSGLVNYSEPNLFFTNLLQQAVTPNDPFYPQQWSHRNLGNNIPGGVNGTPGCDMKTDSAWAMTMGSDKVIVSIVDTGIDTLHEDLSDRMIIGLSINTFSNLPHAWDDQNHGTACAGIVAATGNNNIGVIGVAPMSRIFGVKIFNSAGSTNSTAIINGMIAAWQRGSWVSSNSWGGGSPISAANNAIEDGVNLGRNGKGVIWSFATANSNAGTIVWPANLPNVLAIGGISPCNQRKSNTSCDNETFWGANYGTGLDIVAPCVKIYTTDRTGAPGYTTGNYTSTFNGTSSATPNASGVFALVLALDSNLTWDSVRVRVARTADKVGSYNYNQPGHLGIGGWNNEMGYGRINAYKVVQETQNMMAGSPLVAFNLQSPAPGTNIVSYPMSSTPVTISWDTTGINASFNWIFGTSLPTRILTVPSGTSNTLTLTLGQIDAILDGLGVPVGGSVSGQWDVWAYRAFNTTGPDSLKALNGPRNITLSRGVPQLSSFSLNAPPNNTTITTSVFNNSDVNINWNRSGEGTTYKWKFGAPTISTVLLNVDAAYDSSVSFVNSGLDVILGGLGLNPGDSMSGQWAVWAFNGLDSMKSTQTWNITFKRQDKGDVLIMYDSSSVAGRTSRDSVLSALNEINSTYDLFNKGGQTSANAMTLRGYKMVFLLGQATSVLSVRQKDSLIAYLNSGGTTVQTKSKLIIFSEDIGYQFGRTGSTYQDINFINTYLGWDFVADRPGSAAQGLIGSYLNTGLADSTIGTWPDVFKINTQGSAQQQHVLYLYRRHINNPDSAHGIGMYKPNFNVATFGTDVRSIQNSNGGPTGSPVLRMVKAAVEYVNENLTGFENILSGEIPDRFELSQNFPNPFNPTTKINFAIPKQGMVTMKIFDITGREVAVLVNEIKSPGYYSIDFNASVLSSGVYFYRIQSADFVDVKRMVLIK